MEKAESRGFIQVRGGEVDLVDSRCKSIDVSQWGDA